MRLFEASCSLLLLLCFGTMGLTTSKTYGGVAGTIMGEEKIMSRKGTGIHAPRPRDVQHTLLTPPLRLQLTARAPSALARTCDGYVGGRYEVQAGGRAPT